MEFIEFPKWKYHKSESALIVANKEEETALGTEWASTPAAFLPDAEVLVPGVSEVPVVPEAVEEEKPKAKFKGK
jgi:hypothetical protein